MKKFVIVSGDPEAWGLIPQFFQNDRPAAEQINEYYIAGWNPQPKMQARWKLTNQDGHFTLKYPGDPAMRDESVAKFGDETLVIFRSSWVAIIQPDGSWAVDRLD